MANDSDDDLLITKATIMSTMVMMTLILLL